MLAVSVDQERANVDKFLKGMARWSLTIAHDPAGLIAERLQPDKMPTSYVIDRAGIVRYVNAGFVTSRLTAAACCCWTCGRRGAGRANRSCPCSTRWRAASSTRASTCLPCRVDQERANVDKFLKGRGRWSLTIAHDPDGADRRAAAARQDADVLRHRSLGHRPLRQRRLRPRRRGDDRKAAARSRAATSSPLAPPRLRSARFTLGAAGDGELLGLRSKLGIPSAANDQSGRLAPAEELPVPRRARVSPRLRYALIGSVSTDLERSEVVL